MMMENEDELGANDLASLLLEQKSGNLSQRRLFDVLTEAAVADKAWMNDEEHAKSKVARKCSDTFAMRAHDTRHMVRGEQVYSVLLSRNVT